MPWRVCMPTIRYFPQSWLRTGQAAIENFASEFLFLRAAGGMTESVGTVSDAAPLILKSPFAGLSSLPAKDQSVRCKFDFAAAVLFKTGPCFKVNGRRSHSTNYGGDNRAAMSPPVTGSRAERVW